MGTPKEAYLRLSEDTRRKIEETAVALYAQHPYNAVTARMICRTLKINSATLYRWFDSKDDLYIYLMKTLMDRETFPENLVWDMDDFIVQKIRTGECYTDNERKFLVSWQHIPENVLAKLVFEGVLFDDALIRYNLLRMQQAGEVRSDLNIDFIYMLNQASGDRQILAKQLNISPFQLSYVTNSNEGEGLLFYGNTIIPFKDKFDTSLKLYGLMTTKPNEIAKYREKKDA